MYPMIATNDAQLQPPKSDETASGRLQSEKSVAATWFESGSSPRSVGCALFEVENRKASSEVSRPVPKKLQSSRSPQKISGQKEGVGNSMEDHFQRKAHGMAFTFAFESNEKSWSAFREEISPKDRKHPQNFRFKAGDEEIRSGLGPEEVDGPNPKDESRSKAGGVLPNERQECEDNAQCASTQRNPLTSTRRWSGHHFSGQLSTPGPNERELVCHAPRGDVFQFGTNGITVSNDPFELQTNCEQAWESQSSSTQRNFGIPLHSASESPYFSKGKASWFEQGSPGHIFLEYNQNENGPNASQPLQPQYPPHASHSACNNATPQSVLDLLSDPKLHVGSQDESCRARQKQLGRGTNHDRSVFSGSGMTYSHHGTLRQGSNVHKLSVSGRSPNQHGPRNYESLTDMVETERSNSRSPLPPNGIHGGIYSAEEHSKAKGISWWDASHVRPPYGAHVQMEDDPSFVFKRTRRSRHHGRLILEDEETISERLFSIVLGLCHGSGAT